MHPFSVSSICQYLQESRIFILFKAPNPNVIHNWRMKIFVLCHPRSIIHSLVEIVSMFWERFCIRILSKGRTTLILIQLEQLNQNEVDGAHIWKTYLQMQNS